MVPARGGRHAMGRSASASPADIVLKAPAGISTVQAMSGRSFTVDAHGCVKLSADDAEPLIRSGWQTFEISS